MMAVPIQAGAALDVGTPVPLFTPQLLNGPTTTVGFRAQYDVTRDGRRFLLNVPVADTSGNLPSISVVLNWPATLRK
jgi:hypothetical protein